MRRRFTNQVFELSPDQTVFTKSDKAFICQVYENTLPAHNNLTEILDNSFLRRKYLDNKRLYQAVIENPEGLDISDYFYYYVVTRQAMITAGLMNTLYTEYIATSLVKMAQAYNSDLNVDETNKQKYYPVNMCIATKDAGGGKHVCTVHSVPGWEHYS